MRVISCGRAACGCTEDCPICTGSAAGIPQRSDSFHAEEILLNRLIERNRDRLMMARKAACSAAAVIPEVGDPGQLPQQEHPQPIAGDGLPGAHGQAVDGPCGGEGGGKARLLIGDDSPH